MIRDFTPELVARLTSGDTSSRMHAVLEYTKNISAATRHGHLPRG